MNDRKMPSPLYCPLAVEREVSDYSVASHRLDFRKRNGILRLLFPGTSGNRAACG